MEATARLSSRPHLRRSHAFSKTPRTFLVVTPQALRSRSLKPGSP